MFPQIGTSELLVIGIILLFFFGAKKLKELARGLGESSKEIHKIKREVDSGLFESEPGNAPKEGRGA